MVNCISCSKPYTSHHEGQSNCSGCVNHHYWHVETNACNECDQDKFHCSSPNGTTLLTVDVKSGHYRFTQKSSIVYVCPYQRNCAGGTTAGTTSCKPGSFGPLCQICSDDYYLESDTESCERCAEAVKGSGVMTLLLVASFIFVSCSAILWISFKYREPLMSFYHKNRELLNHLSTKITALIVTMQIIILVNSNHEDVDGEWMPESYRKFLYFLRFLAMDIMQFLPVSCIFGRITHFRILMAWTVCPLVIVSFFALLGFMIKNPAQRGTLRQVACFLVLLFLPIISRAILKTFRCIHYDDGDEYSLRPNMEIMFYDPGVTCDSFWYKFMCIYAAMNVAIWPIGIPVSLMILLYRISIHLDPPGIPECQAIKERLQNEHVKSSTVAFLALQYKPRYWYYEIAVNLSRRLVLTCVVLIFESRGRLVVFVMSISILFAVFEREARAHIEPYVGAFVYLMTWQILLFVIAMLLMDSNMIDDIGEVYLGIILILLNVCMFLVVIIDTRGDIIRQRIEAANERRSTFVRQASLQLFRQSEIRQRMDQGSFRGTVVQDEEERRGRAHVLMPTFNQRNAVVDDDDTISFETSSPMSADQQEEGRDTARFSMSYFDKKKGVVDDTMDFKKNSPMFADQSQKVLQKNTIYCRELNVDTLGKEEKDSMSLEEEKERDTGYFSLSYFDQNNGVADDRMDSETDNPMSANHREIDIDIVAGRRS